MTSKSLFHIFLVHAKFEQRKNMTQNLRNIKKEKLTGLPGIFSGVCRFSNLSERKK